MGSGKDTHLGYQKGIRSGMKRNEGHITNTQQIDLCLACNCMTMVMMDDDGNRYCGKCKQLRLKGVLDD